MPHCFRGGPTMRRTNAHHLAVLTVFGFGLFTACYRHDLRVEPQHGTVLLLGARTHNPDFGMPRQRCSALNVAQLNEPTT